MHTATSRFSFFPSVLVLFLLLAGVPLFPNPAAGQGTCRGGSGYSDGDRCSQNRDCYVCDSGLATGTPCPSGQDSDCESEGLPGTCDTAPRCNLPPPPPPPPGTCAGGDGWHLGKSCTTDSDCYVCDGTGTATGAPCSQDSDCESEFPPDGMCDRAAFCDNSLPVELTSFEAIHLSDGVLVLTWTTASELENAGFEIEVSRDRSSFESVAFVEGRGTTLLPHTYRHELNLSTVGQHHVRLKQIDWDGSANYSPVVEVSIPIPGGLMLEAAYPSPVVSESTIRFISDVDQAARLVLYDVLGRQVQVLFDEVLSGGEVEEVRLTVSDLPNGTYLYVLQTPRGSRTRTLAVTK